MLRAWAWIFALYVFSASVSAFGQDQCELDDDLSSDVTSLNYYPHAGHYYLSPRDNFSIDQHSYRSTGGKSSTNSNKGVLSYAHGLGGTGWRAGFTESMLFNSVQTSTDTTGNQTINSTSGYSDPDLFLYWRFWVPKESNWSADLGLTVTPSVGRKQVSTPAQDANDLNGYWSTAVAADLYGRWEKNEVGANLTFTQRWPGQAEGTSPSTTYGTNSAVIVSGSLTDRFHFNSDWFVDGTFLITEPYPFHQVYDSGNTDTNASPFRLDPQLKLGWRPTPFSLLSLTFTYRHYVETTSSSNGSGSTTDVVNLDGVVSYLVQF